MSTTAYTLKKNVLLKEPFGTINNHIWRTFQKFFVAKKGSSEMVV